MIIGYYYSLSWLVGYCGFFGFTSDSHIYTSHNTTQFCIHFHTLSHIALSIFPLSMASLIQSGWQVLPSLFAFISSASHRFNRQFFILNFLGVFLFQTDLPCDFSNDCCVFVDLLMQLARVCTLLGLFWNEKLCFIDWGYCHCRFDIPLCIMIAHCSVWDFNCSLLIDHRP